jgi:hypothetical protein
MTIELNPINDAADAVKTIVDVWYTIKDRKDRETASIVADLLGLMEELRRTHSTIVKLVSPLRRIPDSKATFANDFVKVFDDFRDFIDARDFSTERTHCHKITQIKNRMKKRKPKFGKKQQWDELYNDLDQLHGADIDIIDNLFKPFIKRFNQAMVKIYQLVKNKDIKQAIVEKNKFLDTLESEYTKNKAMLENMTDVIGKLTAGL